MKTATLAKKRIDAIQQLIQAGNNDINSWAELARRLREDKAERTNLLAYFNRCKRPENPQLMSLEMATEVAKAFVVEPNTIYIELGEGEELPTAKTRRKADTTAVAKKAAPVRTSYALTVQCKELGIDLAFSIAHLPQGEKGPFLGALEGGIEIKETEDAHHRTMHISPISLNGVTAGPLLQLAAKRHSEQLVATE